MVFDKWIKNWKTALAENFFLRMLVIILALGFVASTSIFKSEERIVIVPPSVTDTVWIDRAKASKKYIEQMAVFFATFAGNLSPSNAEYNASEIVKFVHPKRQQDVKADLASQAVYIKKNNVYQSFYPKEIIVNEEEKRAIIEGDVMRFIGTTRVSQEKMVFHISFVIDNYRLFLDDLYVDYPERQKRHLKNRGLLTDDEFKK